MWIQRSEDPERRESYVATTYICSEGAVPLIEKSPSFALDEQEHYSRLREYGGKARRTEHGRLLLTGTRKSVVKNDGRSPSRSGVRDKKARPSFLDDDESVPPEAGTYSVCLPQYFTDTRIICPTATSKAYHDLSTLIRSEKYTREEQQVLSLEDKPLKWKTVESSLRGKANLQYAEELIRFATAVESVCDDALRGPARLTHPIFEPFSTSNLKIDSYPIEYIRATEIGLGRLKDLVTETVARLNTSQNTVRPFDHVIMSADEDRSKFPYTASKLPTYDPFGYTTSLIKNCREVNPELDLTKNIQGGNVTNADSIEERGSTKFTVMAIPPLVDGIHPPLTNKKISGKPQLSGSKGRLFVKYIQSGNGGSMQDWLDFDQFRAAFQTSIDKDKNGPVQDHESILANLRPRDVVSRSKDWENSLERYVQVIFDKNKSIKPDNVSFAHVTSQELSRIRSGSAINLGIMNWGRYEGNISQMCEYYLNKADATYKIDEEDAEPPSEPDRSSSHTGVNNRAARSNNMRSLPPIEGEQEETSSDDQQALEQRFDQAVWETLVNLHELVGGSFVKDFKQEAEFSTNLFPPGSYEGE